MKIFFLRWSLALLLRLKCSGVITAHCSLDLLGSSNPPTADALVAGSIALSHHTWPICVILVEPGFCHVGQAGLKLLASGDLPASASPSAGVTGMSHCAWPEEVTFKSRFHKLMVQSGSHSFLHYNCSSQLGGGV